MKGNKQEYNNSKYLQYRHTLLIH